MGSASRSMYVAVTWWLSRKTTMSSTTTGQFVPGQSSSLAESVETPALSAAADSRAAYSASMTCCAAASRSGSFEAGLLRRRSSTCSTKAATSSLCGGIRADGLAGRGAGRGIAVEEARDVPGDEFAGGGGVFDIASELGLRQSSLFDLRRDQVFEVDYQRWLFGYLPTINYQAALEIYSMTE